MAKQNNTIGLKFKNLINSYHRQNWSVLCTDITFDIGEGEFLALMGPSGSGKTTLLNLIAGIDKADQGLIRVEISIFTTLRRRSLRPGVPTPSFHLPVLQSYSLSKQLRMWSCRCI